MYRIIILSAIVSAMKVVSENLTQVLDKASAAGGFTDIWTPITAAIFGYILLAYMAHRSDGIANGLSSGSSMFSSGDMASSVAAGVAAGMAVATGGAVVGAAAAKGGQSMGDFIKSLGDSGSVSNASTSGSRGFEQPVVGEAPKQPAKEPEMSLQEMRALPANIANKPQHSSGASQSPGGASKAANTAVGETPSSPSGALNPGTGSSAGIGGASSATDQKLDKLMETMGQSKKPTFSDRMSTLNDHVAKEQSTVQANINVNAHDH